MSFPPVYSRCLCSVYNVYMFNVIASQILVKVDIFWIHSYQHIGMMKNWILRILKMKKMLIYSHVILTMEKNLLIVFHS